MVSVKKVDLGEYIILIEYDDSNGYIKVSVLDELEGIIESIEIQNGEIEEHDSDFNPNLN